MKNFNYYAPTQVVFGRNTETQVAELIKKYGGSKVLLHYGLPCGQAGPDIPAMRTILVLPASPKTLWE